MTGFPPTSLSQNFEAIIPGAAYIHYGVVNSLSYLSSLSGYF